MSLATSTCDRSYPLVHPELVEALILPSEETAATLSAELRELSPASAKVLMAGPPQLPSQCRLRLISSKLPRTLELPSEISWARPNLAGDWLVECEFVRRVSERQFNVVLASGLLERRSAVRFQTRIPVGVRWESGEDRQRGLVRDLSEGGLCLLTSRPPEHSRIVQVLVSTPPGEAVLELKIRWSLSVGENHLVGCQFIRGEDFFLLRKLQPASEPQFTEHSPVRRGNQRG